MRTEQRLGEVLLFLNFGIRASGFLVLGIAFSLLASCQALSPQEVASPRKTRLYWPEPPDPPRFVYEYALRDSRSVQGPASETSSLRQIAVGDDPVVSLKKPFDVVAIGGRIYVSDTEARAVYVFDVPRRKFFSFGQRLEGVLKKPLGLAVDGRGQVYVADASRKQVVVFDGLGLFVRALGVAGDLERPTAVAVNREGNRVYVVDTAGVESDRHCVVVYDGDGKKVGAFGVRGGRPGEFNLPVDAIVAPDGTFYVLDAGNFRVQAFDPEGKALRSFGQVGAGFGQFSRPRGIGVDVMGNVYVTDTAFGNVQIFNPDGELLMPLGERGRDDAPATYRLPAGVATDETGRLYVVDQYFQKVEVFRRLTEGEGQRIPGGPSP